MSYQTQQEIPEPHGPDLPYERPNCRGTDEKPWNILVGEWTRTHQGSEVALRIEKQKDDWHAVVVMTRNGTEEGKWELLDAQFANGELTGPQQWSLKPVSSWSNAQRMPLKLVGNELHETS